MEEIAMPIMSKLKFTDVPSSDPIVNARNRLAARLAEQKQILRDPSYVRKTTHWKGRGDARHQEEKIQRVSPWFRETTSGVVMTIKVGFRNVKFPGGKEGIAVGSRDELPGLIDELRSAIMAGEFDELLAEAKTKTKRKAKVANAGSSVKATADASSKRSKVLA
jgi:hypothetical protein